MPTPSPDEPDKNAPSDETLAVAAREGRLEAFDLLARRYQTRLVNFLQKWTGDRATAEDLTQESLLAAYRGLHSFDPERSFATWVFVIAQRKAAKTAGCGLRLNLATNATLDAARAREPSPARQLEAHESRCDLWRRLREWTTDDEFTALWLRYVECASVNDIADQLQRSVAAIKMMLLRLRGRLKQRMTATWGSNAHRELAA